MERGKQRAIEIDLNARLNEQYDDETAYENLSHKENNSLNSDLTSIKKFLATILENQQCIMDTLDRLQKKTDRFAGRSVAKINRY